MKLSKLLIGALVVTSFIGGCDSREGAEINRAINKNSTDIPNQDANDKNEKFFGIITGNTHKYKETNEIFKNPERGLYALRYFSDVPYRSAKTEPSKLNWIANGPYTTFRLDLVLAGSRNTDISQDYIEKIKQQFEFIRQAGLKVILRVTYNEHFGDDDADINLVLSHIKQLKPVLEENKDLIMSIGAGYIGAWGEWHASTHNLTSAENMKKIEEALMQNTPKDLKIMFRRPSFIMSWYPKPLKKSEANSGSNKSRAGFHDDCYNWNLTDMGTFSRDKDTREDQFKYLEQITKFVPVVGELCTADVANQQNSVSCKSGLEMAEKFHYSLLGNQIRGSWTKQEKLPVEVYQEEGCWDDFQRRLGYRFVLKEAKMPKRVVSGNYLNMNFTIVNRGFSATTNERPVYLVLSKDDQEYKFKIDSDPRKWYSDEEKTVNIRQKLPKNLESGSYDLYLWMPDKSKRLQNNPKYSIRVANENVWIKDKGYNKLGTIEVSGASNLFEANGVFPGF